MYKILNKTFTKLPTESQEQQELVTWLKKNNYFYFATNNENNQSFSNRLVAMKIEQKSKAMGKIKGTPDLCVFTENTIVFIELKRQKPILKSGKLGKATNDATNEQMQFIAKVNDYKYAYGFVAYGCDEAISVLVPKSNTQTK